MRRIFLLYKKCTENQAYLQGFIYSLQVLSDNEFNNAPKRRGVLYFFHSKTC